MNLAETNDLLILASTVDNRRFDDATVMVWHELLGDLPFDDCKTAVLAHFANETGYLMPVHIRHRALEADRTRRRDQRLALEAMETERLALEATTTEDRKAEVDALIAELRDTLPPVDPAKFRRKEWLRHDQRRAREDGNAS